MSKSYNDAIQHKYDFVLLFDCRNGNPNGDPDAGNLPRIDAATGRCLVTDACLKRKVRNQVALVKEGTPGFSMYIQGDSELNAKEEKAFQSIGCDEKTIAAYKKGNPDTDDLMREFMCTQYFDIRAFGGVLTKFRSANLNCASIRGPVQISCAESISPVDVQDLVLTRSAVATAAESAKSNTTFGQKPIISYGLFKAVGSISPTLAQKYTGFSEVDLDTFWDALLNLFENDRAAIRPEMYVRKLVVFKHSGLYGDTPSHKLLERVSITENSPGTPIRQFSDYTVTVDKSSMGAVEIIEMG